MDDLIFALDIGTRSIIGVACENEGGTLKVRDIEYSFHKQRSMLDGQIEDIAEVSRVVGLVKNKIEEDLGVKLDKVSIAAAGRALKTQRILLKKDADIRVPLTHDFIKAMEIEALQLAQDVFSDNSTNDLFYCVGYSVLSYTLDEKNISKLEGHRGNKVSVEIIAAFLPHTVIEGLYSCMDNNGLEVSNLTLEPIAAMDLIIPPELRLLNLALVDIGAGTSDIAISKGGTVVGYDMATVAGDEITECLMKNYLIDFNAAERVKAELSSEKEFISITSILGFTEEINKQDILESIKSTVYELCADISEKIFKMNREAPAAIFLAGGGSKTPFLREFLSEILNIPQSRIALTDKKSLRNVDLNTLDIFSPELITPLGIAYSVVLNKNYDFFSVTVNNKKVRLYGIRQMKVMDAILMSGFDTKKLIGFSGKSLRFTINGKTHYFAGEFSTPSKILVNSFQGNIETTIRPGDTIEVFPASDGANPVVRISDMVEKSSFGHVYFNSVKTDISPRYYANNVEVNEDYIIGNSDLIEIFQLNTIGDLYKLYKVGNDVTSFVKGSIVSLDCKLEDGMVIDLLKEARNEEKIQHKESQQISAVHEETEVAITKEHTENIESTEEVKKTSPSFISVTLNGKYIDLPEKEGNVPYIFADMLNYTDIDPSNPKGNIILLHNSKEASYLNIISANDDIIIKWDTE